MLQVKLTVTFPPGAAILGFAEREVLLLLAKGVGVGEEPTNGVCDGAGFKAPFCTVT